MPYKHPPIADEGEFWHCIGLLLGNCVIPEKDRDHKLRMIEDQAEELLAYYRYLHQRDLNIHTNPRKFSLHKR